METKSTDNISIPVSNLFKNKKVLLLLIICFLFSKGMVAQIFITGNSTCINPGTGAPYNINGTSFLPSDTWHVKGGFFPATGDTVAPNQGSPTIGIVWNSGVSTGIVSYYKSGNPTPVATLTVSITTNSISPNFYPYNFNLVPPGKVVTVGFTGNVASPCSFIFYSWASSTDGVNFTDIPNSHSKDLVINGIFNTTTYYRRSVTIGASGTAPLSNVMSIQPAPNPIFAGTVYPSVVTIGAGTTLSSGTFHVTAPTGSTSSCGNTPYIEWQTSPDKTNWTTVTGGTGSSALSFSPSGAINNTTYIRAVVRCSQPVDVSNVAEIHLYAPLGGGTITPDYLTINSGGNPGTLTGSPAQNGNTTYPYTYVWQKSTDGINYTNAGTGISYSPGSISTTTYFRRMVICGSESTFSNVALVQIGTAATVQNYIKSRTITKGGVTTTSAADALTSLHDASQSTEFFDGLGRPVETVLKQGSLVTGNSPTDLVMITKYDLRGRESQKFMPFASSTTDGSYQTNPLTQQQAFNTNLFPDENYFYSKVNYESSPLNRVNSVSAQGNSWTGSNRNITTKNTGNTDADIVREWYVANSGDVSTFGTYSTPGIYPAGALIKKITTNEKGNEVIEFTDLDDKLILKKIQNTSIPDDGSGQGHSGWLCTYYIYDDLGNLRCVVQPEGVDALEKNFWSFNSTILSEQCFRYEYDPRNRMILKKVPGAGEVRMVYDKRDRLVMTQDANQRSANNWTAIKYDDLNRADTTWLYNSSSSFASILLAADSSSNYIPAAPTSSTLLTQTHFDDYTGLPSGLSSTYISTWNGYFSATDISSFPFPEMPVQNSTISTKGLVTWTQQKILDSTPVAFLPTVTIYDNKGRVIQTQTKNITGGIDVTTTQYSWSGQPLVVVSKQEEKKASTTQTTVMVTKMTYDDLGRLVKTEMRQSNSKVNGGAMSAYTTISEIKYDALGQVKTKLLGRQKINTTTYSSTPLETQDYEYNIRGWLLGMNRAYARDESSTDFTSSMSSTLMRGIGGEMFTESQMDLQSVIYPNTRYFGFDLGYDKTDNDLIGGTTYYSPQYTGNITGMVWKCASDMKVRKYDFTYDGIDRLQNALYAQYNGTNFENTAVNYNVMGISYDGNGNIKGLTRYGLMSSGTSTIIDQLSYHYTSGSNKLLNVADADNDPNSTLGDFHYPTATKTESTVDYTYDANGNLVSDANKKIGLITYNYLNLPSIIRITGKGSIYYMYDAVGNKLRKRTVDSTVLPAKITVTNYIANAVYQNDTLQFFGTTEGRARPVGNLFAYDYFLKDHLGNVRMVITDDYDVSSPILETTNYYPFGLTMAGISSKAVGSLENKRKFAGQLFDDDLGWNTYQMKFRTMDPQTGRFLQIDPLAAQYAYNSTYAYAENKTINGIDLEGLEWLPINKEGQGVNPDDRENINGYRWVGYDVNKKTGEKTAKAGTVAQAYTFGIKGRTTLGVDNYGNASKKWESYSSLSTGSAATDKKIASLHPSMQDEAKAFVLKAKDRFGIDLRVTDGFRDYKTQDNIYAQGRTKPGAIVTNARGGYSNHNFGLAIDVVPIENGKANYNTTQYPLIGRIGESVGLEWGGRWKSIIDLPHFQDLQGLSLKELRALPKDEKGLPVLPNQ